MQKGDVSHISEAFFVKKPTTWYAEFVWSQKLSITVVVLSKQKTSAKFVLKYNEDCCDFWGGCCLLFITRTTASFCKVTIKTSCD